MTEQAEKQPFWEAKGLPAPGTQMTPAAYDQLPEMNIYMEFINGVVIYPHLDQESMMAAPSLEHQSIVLNIAMWIKTQRDKIGGTVFIAPVVVQLTESIRLQPDVVWLAPDSQCAQVEKHLRGLPELVVEVLSPATAQRDRTDKFDLYEQYGAVEYWMLDPRDQVMEIYTRQAHALQRLGAYKPEETFQSPVLNNVTVEVSPFFVV